ncbi:MAG TPA: hypothetical protein VHB68_08565 [Steroidobacteraceae bacterium]|nr:hypothetical protein [Steroidobacteraceae bacterium]
MSKPTRLIALLAAAALAAMGAAAVAAGTDTGRRTAAAAEVRAADYPELTEKELGHIRRMIRLARQLPGDWSGMGDDLWAVAERTRQFQLAYMAAALGLVQHNYTPAYRELYRKTMDALIQKMTLPDVWESWLHSSRGGTLASDPDAPDLGSGWIDPIRKDNAMLKGYLLQAGALYEMLYRDGKYDEPGAFTFVYQPMTWGNGPESFRYSLGEIAAIVHREYAEGHYEGIQCEPNRIFPACNNPPILGLINYDQVHGTGYAADVMPKFKAAWVGKHYTNPVTKSNVRFIFVKQNRYEESGDGAVLDGWAGAWMHAWSPEMMQTIYPGQRALYLQRFLTGRYAEGAPESGSPSGNTSMISLGFGQFAFMAAENGDTAARQQLLDYADRNFHPVWDQGAYYYPRSGDYRPDADGNSHGVDTWTGNVLIALARLDQGSGFLKLYREPWGRAELDAPQITDVDDLAVNVSQAWYDPSKHALIVTLRPGPVKTSQTRFLVRQLDPQGAYRVVKDGGVVARLKGGSPSSGDVAWESDGALSVRTDLERPHSFIVVAE